MSDPASAGSAGSRQGLFAWAAGDADRAELLLQQVVSAGSGAPRAQARVHLARLDMHAGSRREAVGRYRKAEEEAGDDPLLLGQIHEGLAWCFFLTREDVRAAVEHARLAVDMAESAGDDVLLGDALSVQAQRSSSSVADSRTPRWSARCVSPRLRRPTCASCASLGCTGLCCSSAPTAS